MLGMLSDKDLAIKIGCKTQAVRDRRRERGIDPCCAEDRLPKGKYDWSRWDPKLGTMADVDLAAQIGCDKSVVRRRRSSLGISPYFHSTSKVDLDVWVPRMGKESDSSIARKAGCAQTTVTRRRNELGIPPFRTAPEAACAAKPRVKSYGEWDEMLGTVPDRVIASRYGVGVSTVCRRRRVLGIPSYAARRAGAAEEPLALAVVEPVPTEVVLESMPEPEDPAPDQAQLKAALDRVPPADPKPQALDWEMGDLLLGRMADGDVAQRLGCEEVVVSARRGALGICPFGSAEGSRGGLIGLLDRAEKRRRRLWVFAVGGL